MPVDAINQKKLHHDLTNVGLRAQATAAGLVQLCIELRRAGVLDEAAVGRVKRVIADEIVCTAPRAVSCAAFRREVGDRLDRLFASEEAVGSADVLDFARTPEPAHGA